MDDLAEAVENVSLRGIVAEPATDDLKERVETLEKQREALCAHLVGQTQKASLLEDTHKQFHTDEEGAVRDADERLDDLTQNGGFHVDEEESTNTNLAQNLRNLRTSNSVPVRHTGRSGVHHSKTKRVEVRSQAPTSFPRTYTTTRNNEQVDLFWA